MKQWVKKLLEQLDLGSSSGHQGAEAPALEEITEDRATLLYMLDTYAKHLIEIDSRPVRKVRAVFDEFAKGILRGGPNSEKLLFRFRQFFSGYRIQEYSYLQKTFEDFKGIIWDFADQLNEGLRSEQARDLKVRESLTDLREAVEANSIGELKEKSREFIDFYIELQTQNDEQRAARIDNIQRNLASVKKKLTEVTESAQRDHLTGAYNRKHMDQVLTRLHTDFQTTHAPAVLLALDIDYFKKVNDIFGHDAGDAVLKEFARVLRELFPNPGETVARMGGEEFSIVLSGVPVMDVVKRAEETLQRIRKEVIIHSDTQIRYTVSIGIAQLVEGETLEKWLKRADLALYSAKEGGRDRYIVAPAVAPSGTSTPHVA